MELVNKDTERLVLSLVFVDINNIIRSDPHRQERSLVILPSNQCGNLICTVLGLCTLLRWITAGGPENMPQVHV